MTATAPAFGQFGASRPLGSTTSTPAFGTATSFPGTNAPFGTTTPAFGTTPVCIGVINI